MRVFVAGATGVIGRRMVQMLTAAGHEVTAMTRSEDRAAALRTSGLQAVVADAFDGDAVREAMVAVRPEVVIHQLTSIPTALHPKRYAEEFAENDRLRTEGTRNLVGGAVAAGARRIVAQSVAFAYAPVGGPVKAEDDPLYLDAPPPFSRGTLAVRALESAVTESDGVEGVVLRYGFFYGPGSTYAADGSVADLVRRRRFPIIGTGEGVFSFIHIDDAASATVAVLGDAPPGTYNVVDDDPAPAREWLPAYAAAIGAKRPMRVPAFVGRLGGGPYAVYLMTQLRGASNARAKERLGWQPARPTWRTGFREALG